MRPAHVTIVVLLAVAGTAWTLTTRQEQPALATGQAADDHSPQAGDAAALQDPLMAQRTKGDPAAPLTIYEVSDFQCPYCRVFWKETLPAIEREYIETGKARFIFLNLPITQIHPNAAAAHEFAMCAARQDRFWPVHDLLYRYQELWAGLEEPKAYFMSLVDSAALNRDSVTACVETGAVRWLVQQEAMAVAQQGVQSTPSFIIEGGLLTGAVPMDQWRPLLDSLFAAKTGGGAVRQ